MSDAESRPLILCDLYPRTASQLFDPPTRARLEALGEVAWHEGAPAPDSFLERHLPRAVALVGQSAFDPVRLDRAPALRAVCNVEGNFLPNVDYAACQRRGVYVLATAPVFARPVAEMALGMALALARRVHEADAAIRRGDESLYGEGDNADSFTLSGRTLGLVGFGNVGRALLPLLRPFGGEILAHDPWLHPSVLRAEGLVPATLEEVFTRAAVVFLLAATTTENAGQIDARLLSRLAPGSLVVLVSRAGSVHFDDLLDAAASGHLRAAIDVWPDEPIPPSHRARRTPNTLLQAHRAGNIPEVWPEMGRMVVDDLEMILRGLPPQRCQRAQWETVSRLRSKPVA